MKKKELLYSNIIDNISKQFPTKKYNIENITNYIKDKIKFDIERLAEYNSKEKHRGIKGRNFTYELNIHNNYLEDESKNL